MRPVVRRWAQDREVFVAFARVHCEGVPFEQFCYSLKWKQLREDYRVRGIWRRFGSQSKALSYLFPELGLLPWKFSSIPKHFWKHKSNQQWFFDWFKKQKNIQSPHDWVKSDVLTDLRNEGGKGLLKNEFGSSLKAALTSVYPNEDWNAVFTRSSGFWHDSWNIRNRLALYEDRFDIKSPKDWLTITTKQCKLFPFVFILQHLQRCGSFRNRVFVPYEPIQREDTHADQSIPRAQRGNQPNDLLARYFSAYEVLGAFTM